MTSRPCRARKRYPEARRDTMTPLGKVLTGAAMIARHYNLLSSSVIGEPERLAGGTNTTTC